MRIRLFSGFTLIELILVMSIFMTLVMMTLPSILGTRSRVDLRASMSTVVGDIKSQQLKAMLADTEGRPSSDVYGVHFETNSYTLFHGQNYVQGETTNSIVPLDGLMQFTSVNFPNGQIVFDKGNGEITNFVSGLDNFSLLDPTSNQLRSVRFNKLGVVVED